MWNGCDMQYRVAVLSQYADEFSITESVTVMMGTLFCCNQLVSGSLPLDGFIIIITDGSTSGLCTDASLPHNRVP